MAKVADPKVMSSSFLPYFNCSSTDDLFKEKKTPLICIINLNLCRHVGHNLTMIQTNFKSKDQGRHVSKGNVIILFYFCFYSFLQFFFFKNENKRSTSLLIAYQLEVGNDMIQIEYVVCLTMQYSCNFAKVWYKGKTISS